MTENGMWWKLTDSKNHLFLVPPAVDVKVNDKKWNSKILIFFFSVPTAVHPTGEVLWWCLELQDVGQNFGDLIDDVESMF